MDLYKQTVQNNLLRKSKELLFTSLGEAFFLQGPTSAQNRLAIDLCRTKLIWRAIVLYVSGDEVAELGSNERFKAMSNLKCQGMFKSARRQSHGNVVQDRRCKHLERVSGSPLVLFTSTFGYL